MRNVVFNKIADSKSDPPHIIYEKDFPNRGIFHQWVETGTAKPSAIVETLDGMIEIVPHTRLKFVNPGAHD